MESVYKRRELFKAGAAAAGAMLGAGSMAAVSSAEPAKAKPPAKPRYCLNTSTIRGQGLSLV